MPGTVPPLVVGFDLDMTLVDSAAAITASVLATGRRYGVDIDPAQVAATIGLPLDMVFPDVLPGVPYEDALAVYRADFLAHGVARCSLLPGAAEAVAAVMPDLSAPVARRFSTSASGRRLWDSLAQSSLERMRSSLASYPQGTAMEGDAVAGRGP